jgi:hypothetical protein
MKKEPPGGSFWLTRASLLVIERNVVAADIDPVVILDMAVAIDNSYVMHA